MIHNHLTIRTYAYKRETNCFDKENLYLFQFVGLITYKSLPINDKYYNKETYLDLIETYISLLKRGYPYLNKSDIRPIINDRIIYNKCTGEEMFTMTTTDNKLFKNISLCVKYIEMHELVNHARTHMNVSDTVDNRKYIDEQEIFKINFERLSKLIQEKEIENGK